MLAGKLLKPPQTTPNYIEDVFSTWLYAGNGATTTITNNIDLSTKGGLVWIKDRTSAYNNHLYDTTRGIYNGLVSNTTAAQTNTTTELTAFNTNGFSVGVSAQLNSSGDNYVSWTFRKQPKFFDVVTWTGTGSATTIAHNLGSVPGCIIVKRTDAASSWPVYHVSNGASKYMYLNATSAVFNDTAPGMWNTTTPTSTVFSVGTDTYTNASGGTYVAYLFAHNAGGFGLTDTDNVISCGSMTLSSGTATVNLGYEPQYIMYKRTDAVSNWEIADNMRGLNQSTTGGTWQLSANTTSAEDTSSGIQYITPTSTGFVFNRGAWSSANVIYIAIRRGPMKVPTDATKVFAPVAYAGNDTANRVLASGITEDLSIIQPKDGGAYGFGWVDRLRGNPYIISSSTGAETSSIARYDTNVFSNGQTGVTVQTNGAVNSSAFNYIHYGLRRAPSFFDEVCYTGDGNIGRTVNHNLGVAPEFMIIKRRDTAGYLWRVYNSPTTALELNTTAAQVTDNYWNNTAPTSSVFTLYNYGQVNASGGTYVAYLFATCAGVSKVGTYTGNGSTQAIACGFAGGARFVLIKRTDSTGGWYVYDTARGMSTLTDPYLFLNDTAAEVATLGSVTTTTGGFTVNASILAAINTNAATYIFLAIA